MLASSIGETFSEEGAVQQMRKRVSCWTRSCFDSYTSRNTVHPAFKSLQTEFDYSAGLQYVKVDAVSVFIPQP